MASESKAPPVRFQETPDLDSGTEPGTELQEEAPWVWGKMEGEVEAPQLVLASSYSSLDEAVVTAGVTPPQDNHKALLVASKRVGSYLGIQADVVKESSHSLLDILMAVGHSMKLSWTHLRCCGRPPHPFLQRQSVQSSIISCQRRVTSSYTHIPLQDPW